MRKFFFLVVLFVSCSKGSDTATEDITAVKVTDSITGSPVVGAELVLFKCGNLGCAVSSSTVFTGKTDNNGIVNIPSAKYQDLANELNVFKSDYLDFEVQRSSILKLRPKGWLRLHIVKTGNYAAGSRIGINNQFNPYSVLVNAAADSIVLMSGGGGVKNNVDWQVINMQGQELNRGTLPVQVPRLDTANVLLNY